MATDYTPNYNLDLYAGTDKPNLRDQYNAAMGKIDTQMKANADGVTNANANVGTLQTRVGELQKGVTALEGTVAGHATQITQVQGTANSALSLAQSNKTDIADTEADVTSLSDRVTSVESSLAQNEHSITTLQQDVANRAPTNHSSPKNTYGVGSTTNYGHLKVVDSGAADAASGTAASPKMVNDLVNVAPSVLQTESVKFDDMTETLTVSVILNSRANLICVSLGEIVIHTSAAMDAKEALSYKLPAQYRPTRKLRAALCVSAATITVGMNATIDTDGTIEISFGASEPITSGYTVGGNAMFIYGLGQ